MSRLTALHIPFVSGHNDSADPRVLPDGVFASVTNGRLRKSGSLALRRGWRPLTMTESATANEFVAHDIYSYGSSLVALGTLGAAATQRLATYVASAALRPWHAYQDAAVPPATRVTSVGNIADHAKDAWSSAYALTSDGVYGCAMYQHSDGGPTQAVFRIFLTATDKTVAEIVDGAGIAKVFSIGSQFGRVRLEGANLVYASMNPADPNPTFVTRFTLLTGVASNAPFDVAYTLGHIHTVVVQSGAATYRRFTDAGLISGVAKTVASADVTAYPAMATDGTSVTVLTKANTGNVLSRLTFQATGTYSTLAGPTALYSSIAVFSSRFCVGIDQGLAYCAAQANAANDVLVEVFTTSGSLVESAVYRSSVLVCGWVFATPYAGIGIAHETKGGTGENGVFAYTDSRGPWLYGQFGTACASPDDTINATPSRVVVPGQASSTRDVLVGGFNFLGTFVYPFTLMFRLRDTARRPGVVLGDSLYLSGGVLTQWSGADLVENGMIAPTVRSVTNTAGSGSMASGTYSYRAVVTWFDEARGLHRSVVSSPRNAALSGGDNTCTVVVDAAKTLRRNSNLGANPTVVLFRTEAGPGELFYQVGFRIVDLTNDGVTFTDTQADSAILSKPRLYTEGEFGAVSGVLDIAPSRPSAYAAAMRDRLVLGAWGSVYQVSQTLLPEEPVAFAEPGVSGPVALSYFDSVEGDLTGVATLDDTIVLGTADAIYVAGGEGPNLAGVGEFQSPARLPSDVGFYDWRSIIETSEGLWFLGDVDKLYLLPRGGGVPAFQGEAVQDRFTGPVVGCARETEDAIVAWAVAGAAPALVVHDVVHGHWFSDPLPFTPVALGTHQGRMYAVASTGVIWTYDATAYGDGTIGDTPVVLRAETGHIQVFGQAGQGRIAAIDVVGEAHHPATIAADISYDDGVTWTSLGSHVISVNVTGETFQRQFYPSRQRGGRFRLRVTMTPEFAQTEGCRLTGFTVWYRGASGPTRLASASRK